MTQLLRAGLAGLLFMTAAQGQEGGAPVKIGVAAPMTGPNAAFGAQIRNA